VTNSHTMVIEPEMTSKTISQTYNEGESGYVEISLSQVPDDTVYVAIRENKNDQFNIDGSYWDTSGSYPVFKYPILTFDASNFDTPQRISYTCYDDSKIRGTVVGDLILSISSSGSVYNSLTEDQHVNLTAIDND